MYGPLHPSPLLPLPLLSPLGAGLLGDGEVTPEVVVDDDDVGVGVDVVVGVEPSAVVLLLLLLLLLPPLV